MGMWERRLAGEAQVTRVRIVQRSLVAVLTDRGQHVVDAGHADKGHDVWVRDGGPDRDLVPELARSRFGFVHARDTPASSGSEIRRALRGRLRRMCRRSHMQTPCRHRGDLLLVILI